MERFWTKVEKTMSCWLWKASVGKRDGYGRFKHNGRVERAHRFAYTLLVGPIPNDLMLDHTCRNRACCRPDHLEPKTNKANTLCGTSFAAENAKKQTCLRSHPFTPENTKLEKYAHGVKRKCRTCVRERSQMGRHRPDAPTRASSILAAPTITPG